MTSPSWKPNSCFTAHPHPVGLDVGDGELAQLAYAELRRDERLGPTCAGLLHRLVTALVAGPSGSVRFPTLKGAWVWAEDDRLQATHEIFLHLSAASRTQRLLERCTSKEALEAALWIRSQSWFQDRARTTDKGAFQRKLSEALQHGADTDALVAVEFRGERAWALPNTKRDVVPLAVDDLRRAAAAVEVPVLRYRSSRRRDPGTTRDGLLAVVVAILERNGGALPQRIIRDVCIHRLGLPQAPQAQLPHETAEGDEPARHLTDEAGLWDDPADEWLLDLHAQHVLAQLDDEAVRALSAYVQDGIGGVAAAFDVKRAASSQRVRAARVTFGRLVTATGHGPWEQALAERALFALAV